MRLITIIGLILLSPVWLYAQKTEKPPVWLFSLGNEKYLSDEFAFLFKKNHPAEQERTAIKANEYFDLFVNFKLKVREARALGLDTTEAFRKEFSTYLEELKKPYLASEDDLVRLSREVYERLKEEVAASHILISCQPDASPSDTLAAYQRAMKIREQILSGSDFRRMAESSSEDPSAKNNGGKLGYFTALQMVYPFESATYALSPGQISLPVRSRFGYHIIRLENRRASRGEVEVSHIILRSGQVDETKLRNKIFEIYDQLQAGRSWDELCKQFSDDPGTRNSGGRLRPFGVGVMAAFPEFENAAFSLQNPGDISDPFRTTYGWHIVRLEKKIPLLSFEELDPALRKKIARDERMQIAARQTMLRRRHDEGYAENQSVWKEVEQLADSTLLRGKWKPSKIIQGVLFSLDGRNINAVDFLKYAARKQKPSAGSASSALRALYDQFVDEEVKAHEEKRLSDRHADFRNLLQEYREGILLFSVMEREVWNKASADTAGMARFYKSNIERYKAGERVRARFFGSSDSTIVNRTIAKIHKGDTLRSEDLRPFKVVQSYRNFLKGESRVMDAVPWSIGIHKTSMDGIFYIVDVESLIPAGQRTLDEVRTQVTTDYQEALEKEWLQKLRSKYPLKVNNKARKNVIKELTASK